MCSKKYKWPSDLTQHKRQVHKKVKYDCDQCNESFDYPLKLRCHKQKAHKGMRFECKDCGKEFAFKHDLTRHQKQQHKGKPHHEEPARKKIKPNLEDHCQENEEDANRENPSKSFQSFSCEKCGMSLSSLKILKMHKEMVHP